MPPEEMCTTMGRETAPGRSMNGPLDSWGQGRSDAAQSACWCEDIESRPATIILAMLGLLGGTCGQPVSIWMRDFSSDVACCVQRFLMKHLSTEQFCEIRGQSDLSRLAEEGSPIVLGVVDPLQSGRSLGQAVLWAIGRRRGSRTPAILFASECGQADSPAALLALRGSPDELRRTRDWFLGHPDPDPRIRAHFSHLPPTSTPVDLSSLLPVIAPTNGPVAWRPRLRTLETLQGLLAGHALLRAVLASASRPQRVVASLSDYRCVYAFLQSPVVAAPEETGDPLLEAMVERANLYLEERARQGCAGVFKQGRTGLTSRAPRVPGGLEDRDRAITCAELADLGHSHSPLLKSLIDAVVKSRDPGRIRKMGLDQEVSDERCLQGLSAAELLPMLACWSIKQVRTRFVRLRREGFITSERFPDNGADWFKLPEELRWLPAEFQGLPSPEQAKSLVAGSVQPA
jgi:hypothetical protein